MRLFYGTPVSEIRGCVSFFPSPKQSPPLEEMIYCNVQVLIGCLFCFSADYENNVKALLYLMDPGSCDRPQLTLDPIPFHRFPKFSVNGKTNPGFRSPGFAENNYKQGMSQGTPLFICVLKIPVFSQPVFLIQPFASRKGLMERV